MMVKGRWILLVLLCVALVTACDVPGQLQSAAEGAEPAAFDALARWVPVDAMQPFFLNLKPSGETGQYWERIRSNLQAEEPSADALDSLLSVFHTNQYSVDVVISGPAVAWAEGPTEYTIYEVNNETAAAATLGDTFAGIGWKEEQIQGTTLHYGPSPLAYGQGQLLTWAIREGLLFVANRATGNARPDLEALLNLAEEDSVAALPAWHKLRARLPADPMGILFFDVAAQTRRSPQPSNPSLGTAFVQQLETLALAAVPEAEGMRVEIAGSFAFQDKPSGDLGRLFGLSAVDPMAWTEVPADTAVAVFGYDGAILWPLLKEAFGIGGLDDLRALTGLDLEADLLPAGGPLDEAFAMALTPPLPDQPISQGAPAGQVLVLARGASEKQMAGVQAAIEGRGVLLTPGQVEGIEVQVQVGTELIGYALSYGIDRGTLFLGSSPGILAQALTSRQQESGVTANPTFQVVMTAMPDKPNLVAYLSPDSMTSLLLANMTEQDYQKSLEYRALEAFDGLGLGLRLDGDRLEGVLYFAMGE